MTRLIITIASAYYLWNARSKARKNRDRCIRLVAALAQGGTHD